MAKSKSKTLLNTWLQSSLLRVTQLHFVYVGIYALYIIIADASRLITPELVLQRWTMLGILLAGTALIWYLARYNFTNLFYYRFLVFALITLDIAMATFNIYTQRGMASRAVILFVIPIVVSCILLSRAALFFTAILCTTAYVLATMRYFVVNFNEGYKVELYTEVGFYSAMFFVFAGLLWAIIRPQKNT